MDWEFLGHVRAIRQTWMDPSRWILYCCIWSENIGRIRTAFHCFHGDSLCCEMRTCRVKFFREVYCMETLLYITCQIISESKHHRFCFSRFVSVWPASEVVDGVFEVCPSVTKFCPLANKPVALGFSL